MITTSLRFFCPHCQANQVADIDLERAQAGILCPSCHKRVGLWEADKNLPTYRVARFEEEMKYATSEEAVV